MQDDLAGREPVRQATTQLGIEVDIGIDDVGIPKIEHPPVIHGEIAAIALNNRSSPAAPSRHRFIEQNVEELVGRRIRDDVRHTHRAGADGSLFRFSGGPHWRVQTWLETMRES